MGMILKQTPVGEYDRRITLLTKERGKISAFARGARKQGSRFAASTMPFCFGNFKLFEGRESYSLMEADIQNYFEDLMKDYIGACYGMYFAEVADYYTRENNDEREMLKLLYQSMRAVCIPSLSRDLVKCIFELRSLKINGEYPGVLAELKPSEPVVYTLNYIESSAIEKLYTFTVTAEVLKELSEICDIYRKRFVNQHFKSLEILRSMC